jgi:hypothetical protein
LCRLPDGSNVDQPTARICHAVDDAAMNHSVFAANFIAQGLERRQFRDAKPRTPRAAEHEPRALTTSPSSKVQRQVPWARSFTRRFAASE